jgi:hypothetical protein
MAGVLIGHWLAYLLVIPEGHAREQYLAQTGHGYWLVAVRLCLALGLAGLGAFGARFLRPALRQREASTGVVRWLAGQLIAIQVLAFAGMEVSERLLSHVPLSDLFSHHVVLLTGLAVQVLVACLGAWLLALLGRALERVLGIVPGQDWLSPEPLILDRAVDSLRAIPVALGSASVRGPPAS